MQNAKCEQQETVDNCFLCSECAETRSNASEACPHEQNDYVSRDRMQNFYLRPTRRTLQGKGARALIESRIFIISLPDSMLKIKCSDLMR